jgi:3-oxoacyl-[acyl-carrier-protein] synthase-1
VFIVGLGASTAIGRNAWASAAAVRAGVAGFRQHPYLVDTAGEPMRAAIAPWIDIGVRGCERFAQLLLPAADEALAALANGGGRRIDASRWVLALALPGPRPGVPDTLANELTQRLAAEHAGVFASSGRFAHGHAAGLMALHAAFERLRNGTLDGCLLAAVDSWIGPEAMEWLEAHDQLHGAGPSNNAWGFVPGEAAAAMVVVRESVARHCGLEPLGQIRSVGVANEPRRIKTQTVCIGEGLTQALRAALDALPQGVRVSDMYCDMNGEPYRADEFGFAALRTKEHFEALSEFVAPADCWGDVGAAGSLLQSSLACIAARKRYARGHTALVWASAETGERAAAVISAPARLNHTMAA